MSEFLGVSDASAQNLAPDSILGRYRILEKIGSGGMGEVYLALDTELERRIAIKVLPAEVAGNSERMQRFFREARAASALNHPHIAHIYEIGETDDGLSYIAMEYVDGVTLGTKIHRDRVSLLTLLKYLQQVAEGLAKAHAAGIVHRDLKPDNIIVSRDGYAKVLDFGIAKLIEPEIPFTEAKTVAMDRPLSIPGTVLGTAGYMSPEQARGSAEVDQRADIFSFGCILYEAATGGRRPFAGETVIDSLHSVLHAEPVPLKDINPNAPADLQRIIRRCLRKDPEDRYQSIKDVAIETRDLRSELKKPENSVHWSDVPSVEPAAVTTGDRATSVGIRPTLTSAPGSVRTGSETGEQAPPKKMAAFTSVFWAALFLLGLGAAGFGIYKFFLGGREVPVGAQLKVTPLTSSPIVERNPSLSPDGKQIAYVYLGDKGDNFDIYVKITDAGSPLRLTSNPAKEMSPAWSPDGRFVAFVRGDGPDKGFYVIPALGGAERRVADVYGWNEAGLRPQALDWAPDGKTLAIVDKAGDGDPWSVFLLDLDTGEKRKLTTPPADFDGDTFVSFSPDGHTVAFLRRRDASLSDIFTVPVSGGEPSRVTTDGAPVRGLDWTVEGDHVVFSSERAGGNPTLWMIPSTGGEAQPVAGTGDNVSEVSIAARGGRLVYSQFTLDVNLWRMEVPDQAGSRTGTLPSKFIASNRFEGDPQYSPDGKRIVFSSDRSGTTEIWIADAEGQNPVELTSFGSSAVTGSPRWSPDGHSIAFDSRASGNADVYMVGVDGGAPRRLTTDPAEDVVPSWSADGRFVYFASRRTGRFEVWKVPTAGGDAVQVTHDGGFVTAESSDGSRLYYMKGRPDASLWSMSTAGGEDTKVLDINLGRNWAVSDKGIYYFLFPTEEKGPYTLEYFDPATHKTSRLASLQGPARFYSVSMMTLSPDKRWIVYSQRDQLDFDLMLVENFR